MYLDQFAVSRHFWSGSTRPCAYSLALGDIAFADFGLDGDGLLYILRISFDGHGCCTPDTTSVSPMALEDSIDLVGRMDDEEQLQTEDVRSLLRRYFEANRGVIWEDALVEWGLVAPRHSA